jgi:hypothetical protein
MHGHLNLKKVYFSLLHVNSSDKYYTCVTGCMSKKWNWTERFVLGGNAVVGRNGRSCFVVCVAFFLLLTVPAFETAL